LSGYFGNSARMRFRISSLNTGIETSNTSINPQMDADERRLD
jgi:hypothetical protein